MKVAAALFVLAAAGPAEQPDAFELRKIELECGETHCQMTREHAEAIARFQRAAAATIDAQREEISRLRRCREVNS